MTSVEHLDKLCKELIQLRILKKEVKAKLEEVEKDYKSKQSEIIELLDSHGKSQNEGDFGKVSIVSTLRFKIEDKDQVTRYLKEAGKYEDIATLSESKVSAWLKEEYPELVDRIKEGEVVEMPIPGVYDATGEYQYLRVTEKK